ncbi:hypothetical protein AJ80_07710 [Polytolypa hystricis UAMH7299]|uniref:Uncharacterized protein n=1 Tax=Polytolypa hystricis (strain UAMH7299) TaxID=1447883 RepID=A0A2B7XKB2_POLH7|nr:hypothetical protein AJ80_07710 [Polytolypa hystricis UAMH7299]
MAPSIHTSIRNIAFYIFIVSFLTTVLHTVCNILRPADAIVLRACHTLNAYAPPKIAASVTLVSLFTVLTMENKNPMRRVAYRMGLVGTLAVIWAK